MSKVYVIVKYDLKGKVLYTCKEAPTLDAIQINEGWKQLKFVERGTNKEAYRTHLWEYSTQPKANAISPDEKLMPYFANVTEDLPAWATWKPKTWTNCQLMTEKHGGYLQFWHEPTKEVLRIAINSNSYEPIDYIDAIHFAPDPNSGNVRCLNGSAYVHRSTDIKHVNCNLCLDKTTNANFWYENGKQKSFAKK